MSEFWKFWYDSPFLSFASILGFISIANSILFTIRRVLRALNISFRGWPPVHLDADGDFRDCERED